MNSATHQENDDNYRDDAAVFALGGSDTRTEQEHPEKNPQINKHIPDAQNVLELLASANAVNPHPELRQKILQKIMGGQNSFSRIVQLQSKVKTYQRYSIAASVMFAITTSATMYYKNLHDNSNAALHIVKEELERSKELHYVLATKADVLDQRVHLLTNPDIVEISMKSLKKELSQPVLRTSVYWDTKENTVFLEVQSLPENNDSTDYQLWAITDGKPKDLGVIHFKNIPSIFKMKNTDSADAFAITLEEKGGKPSPTLENLTVLGKVSPVSFE